MTVTLCPAGWRDAWRLWRWRNDQLTRRMARSQAWVGPLEHLRWLRGVLQPESRQRLYVARWSVTGEPVGTGRLDLRLGVAEVSLTVAPAWRGRGCAREIIGALVAEAANLGCSVVMAAVRGENGPSIRAFAAAGFAMGSVPSDGYVYGHRRC